MCLAHNQDQKGALPFVGTIIEYTWEGSRVTPALKIQWQKRNLIKNFEMRNLAAARIICPSTECNQLHKMRNAICKVMLKRIIG